LLAGVAWPLNSFAGAENADIVRAARGADLGLYLQPALQTSSAKEPMAQHGAAPESAPAVSDQPDTQPLTSQPPPGVLQTAMPSPSAGAAAPADEVDAGSALHSAHLHRVLRRHSILIVLSVAGATAFGLAVAGAGMAVLMFGIAVVSWALYAYQAADEASLDSLWGAYAQQRGMRRTGDDSLPEATPLLRKGNKREVPQVLCGDLGSGVEGRLAIYKYIEVERGGIAEKEGKKHVHPFTVAIAELPQSGDLLPHLYCYRKVGPAMVEGHDDPFLRGYEPVDLESVALAKRYALLVAEGQDPNWIRQLFSPSFIVWLTESAPKKFAFELEDGVLCCSLPGYPRGAARLDELREAAVEVATRIREEVSETHRTRG